MSLGIPMPSSAEEKILLQKMKAAIAIRDCLGYLSERAKAEGFPRTKALIQSTIAAVDDELSHHSQFDFPTRQNESVSQ